MPNSSAGGAAFLNGEEIVNDARTLSYLEAGYGPRSLNVSGGCACPRIRELIECDSEPYSSPALDPAPWYSSSVPESADFAGFLTISFEGLGSTYTREVLEKVTGGAVLGRMRPRPRTLTWRGFLFGRSDCAVRYGLAWFTANLKGTNCSCNGEDLDLMVCCPELDATPPVSGCTSLPAINRPDSCPPFTQPDAFRQLKNVGLVDGPRVLSTRKIGCRPSCTNESCSNDDTIIMEIEFSLMAGNPYMFGCPVCLCAEQPFPNNDEENCQTTALSENPKFIKVAEGGDDDACAFECEPPFDCTLTDDNCDPVNLPEVPDFEDSCFCDPIDPVLFCCEVPSDSFGQFFEGAPIIEIYSGSSPMRATTVRFFANPQGQDCCDISTDPCLHCDSVQIRYIPADSIMTIDGTTRMVTVQCPGMGAPILADHLTATPFSWPILHCMDYCICVETEGAIVAPNATVSILIVPREM